MAEWLISCMVMVHCLDFVWRWWIEVPAKSCDCKISGSLTVNGLVCPSRMSNDGDISNVCPSPGSNLCLLQASNAIFIEARSLPRHTKTPMHHGSRQLPYPSQAHQIRCSLHHLPLRSTSNLLSNPLWQRAPLSLP